MINTPMLAHKVGKKEIDWSAKNFIQPKLDGVRCMFTKDGCLLYTSPSPRDRQKSRMPSSA